MTFPSHEATEASRLEVRGLASHGTPHKDIGQILGISEPTLRKHYRAELDFGMAQANAHIAGKCFQLAMGGNVAMLIFWTKVHMGWSEKIVIRHENTPTASVTDEQLWAIVNRGHTDADESDGMAH